MKDRIHSFLQNDENFPGILVVAVILYLYKVTFWPLTFLFVLTYVIVIVIFLIRFRWNLSLLKFFYAFMPPLILVMIFLFSVLVNRNYSSMAVLKDVLLILLLLSIFYFLYWNTTVLKKSIPITFTVKLIIYISVIVSAFNLLFQLFPAILPVEFLLRMNLSYGSAIANDYNFFSLFILFALIILNFPFDNYVLSIRIAKWARYSINLLFILNIILSGSRRGIIVLFVLLSIYAIVSLRKEFSIKNVYNAFKKRIKLIFLFSIIVFVIYLVVPKQKISIIIYRYATLIGINDFNSIERFLWEREHDVPKNKNYLIDNSSFNPKSNYWSKNPSDGTTVSNIKTPYGPGLKLIRKGPKIDFSLFYTGPRIIYYANHTYKISFKIKFLKGDFDSFYVGWWVNDGGKGISKTLLLNKNTIPLMDGWYSCTSEYTFIDNHVGLIGFINSLSDQTSIIISDFELIDLNTNPGLPRYEFEYYGKEDINVWLNKINAPWNNLNLINNGDFSHGLSFWESSSDALTIKVENVDNKNCAHITRGDGNGVDWSLIYAGRDIEFRKDNEYQISFNIKLLTPKYIPFYVGYWVNEGEGYQSALKLEIDTLNDNWLEIKARYKFKNNYTNLIFPINCQINNSSFYITDIRLTNLSEIQYQSYPVIVASDSVSNDITLNVDYRRSSRMKYALKLWKTKYKWYNKLFGHGFDYYDWYAEEFPNSKNHVDYPHNPFLSVIFYSGIIGFVLYIWLLYKIFTIYLKYRKVYGVLLVCFLITFFFSFFSGSSPFDPPIMGFFMLLPFFLEYVSKNKIPSNG